MRCGARWLQDGADQRAVRWPVASIPSVLDTVLGEAGFDELAPVPAGELEPEIS